MAELDPNLPTETEDVKPETETKPEETPAAPAIDYEKKFKESTRENQVLQEKLKAREAAGQELTKEPTDSDLRAAFPDWELYDDIQKNLARRAFGAERSSLSALAISRQIQEEREWNTSLELAIASDPALQGKEQAFKDYASKPQYKSVPMDVLIASFLQKNNIAPPTPTPKPGLEPGSGGPRKPETLKSLSGEQLEALRKTDYKAYEQYIRTHDIDTDF